MASDNEKWEEFEEEGEWGGGWGGGEVEGEFEQDEGAGERHEEARDEATMLESELDPGWSLSATLSGVKSRDGERTLSPPATTRTGGALKLGGGGGGGGVGGGGRKMGGNRDSGPVKTERTAEGDRIASLSTEDQERLEEKATWSIEPDFFADMAPAISKKNPPQPLSTKKQHSASKLSSLKYQPSGKEVGTVLMIVHV